MPNRGVLAGSEAVPEIEHPWVKARRLSKELSQTLTDCDEGRWYAYTLPENGSYSSFYGAINSPGAHETAVDRVNRLAWELSAALSEYQGGRFQAVVLPSDVGGRTVMLTVIEDWDRRAQE